MNIGSAFGGFAQGLGEGVQAGVNIAQKQEAMKLQQAELKLRYVGTVEAMRKWSPEMREQFGKPLLKQLGSTVGVDMGPVALEAFAKGDQKLVDQIAGFMAKELQGGAELKAVLTALNDPEKIAAFGAQISSMKHQREQEKTSRAQVGISAMNAQTSRMQLQATLSTPERQVFNALKSEGMKEGLSETEATAQAYRKMKEEKTTSPEALTYSSAFAQIKKNNPNMSDADARMKALQQVQGAKVGSEIQGIGAELARVESELKNDPKNPELIAQRDRLKVRQQFGDKGLPQPYVDFMEGAKSTTNAINNLANILNDPKKASIAKFTDRADVRQAVSQLVIAYKNAEKMGANFTTMERSIVDDSIGGNPNDVFSRLGRGREDFVNKLRRAHEVISSKVATMEEAQKTGKITIAPFAVPKAAPLETLPEGTKLFRELPDGTKVFRDPKGNFYRQR
jgi:carbon monoxide dehydrogenase subunit G